MRVKAYCLEDGHFVALLKELREPSQNEIQVRSILCGICGSDTAAYAGYEPYLGDHMWGHEGLGEVVAIGKGVTSFKPGDLVATYWHPCFWERYNIPEHTAVKVPCARPEYILQPVACALNASNMIVANSRTLIIGSGFMAWLLAHLRRELSQELFILARHNQELFKNASFQVVSSIPDESIDLVILASVNAAQHRDFDAAMNVCKIGGTIIHYSTPHKKYATNFAQANWKQLTMLFPSPRGSAYQQAFQHSVDCVASLNYRQFLKGWHISEVDNAFKAALTQKSGITKHYIRMQ